ncbi:MAG: hypothetical protein HPY87_09025 [Fervidobacterium sp.]|uniref:hypothetical protein n=1 Tax=Fervidobacterium sp. TaxID=1871331 RepID=UPI0025BDBABE|nr:hypothetical protein [Fervidobacterium sp.]NPU90003.1 hypothetical protein [Fervidobacterium sp.]
MTDYDWSIPSKDSPEGRAAAYDAAYAEWAYAQSHQTAPAPQISYTQAEYAKLCHDAARAQDIADMTNSPHDRAVAQELAVKAANALSHIDFSVRDRGHDYPPVIHPLGDYTGGIDHTNTGGEAMYGDTPAEWA